MYMQNQLYTMKSFVYYGCAEGLLIVEPKVITDLLSSLLDGLELGTSLPQKILSSSAA